jgi:methylamine utilization protein MauE
MRVDPAVAAIIAACSALLFGGAAVHKLRDIRRFDEIFAGYGLLIVPARLGAARLVPVLELLVACGLLFAVSRPLAALAGMLLLWAYASAISVNLLRGRRDLACGCGGPYDRRPIAGWMVWRNVTVSLVLLALVLPPGMRPLEPTDAVTMAFGTLTAVLLYLCVDRLLGVAS